MHILSWLRAHSIRAGEAVWLVLVFIYGAYKALGAIVPLPSVPQELALPVLILLLTGLYVTAKWSTWTSRPVLILSDRLELDTLDVWRLTCWNKGKACEVRAQLLGAIDDAGHALVDPQHLPIELPWTHLSGRPRLGPNDRLGATAPVLTYNWQAGIGQRRFRTLPRYALQVYGGTWQPFLGQISRFRNRTLSITVAVDAPEQPEIQAVEHTYRLAFDRTLPTRFRATT
jgi:hypothetical protein